MFSAPDVTSPVLGDGSAVYTLGVSQRRSGATTYDLHDGLGSATRQTNSSASVSATRTYDAFGMLLASTGSPQGPFGFAATSGYQEDGDTGLKLLGHRLYDPSTGRFLTRDPIKDGRNWYDYCGVNPLKATDATGLDLSFLAPAMQWYVGPDGPLLPWDPNHAPYKTPGEAASAAIGAAQNSLGSLTGEFQGEVVVNPAGGKGYVPTEPYYSDGDTPTPTSGLTVVAGWHTHPTSGSAIPSNDDANSSYTSTWPEYVSTWPEYVGGVGGTIVFMPVPKKPAPGPGHGPYEGPWLPIRGGGGWFIP